MGRDCASEFHFLARDDIGKTAEGNEKSIRLNQYESGFCFHLKKVKL